jgi:hypothetical protein
MAETKEIGFYPGNPSRRSIRMAMRRFVWLVICACAALVMRCSHSMSIVTTGGSEVVGTMVKQDGTPVQGATVYLDTAGYASDTTYELLDTTTTDDKGHFAIKRKPLGGMYNIYGNYNNKELVVLIRDVKDTVASDKDHTVDIGTHIMLPPGFISGKVVVDEPSLAGTVCYIPGTSLMAITDDDGSFVMSGVPADTYRVYFAFPNYIVGRDTGVIVTSGETRKIGTFILYYDPNKPAPAPRSVTVSYDTVRGVAVLSWHPVHVSDLLGYYVYRGLNGNSIGVLDSVTGADTVFHDKLYRSFSDLTIDTCRYQVAAFDSAHNPVNKSNPITLVTVPPAFVRTVFTFGVIGAVNDTVEAGDTIAVRAAFSNTNNLNIVVAWYGAYPDQVLKQDSVKVKSGADTLRHAFTFSGRAVLHAVAVDDHGNSWLDSIVLAVLPRHVDAVSVDSATTGVVVRWQQSHQSGFAAYRLFRTLTGGDTLIYTTDVRADTSHTVLFSKNGVFQYHVAVVDSQGRVSPPGKSIAAWIKNSPPVFTNDTAAIAKSARVGDRYQVDIGITDVNGDSLTLKLLGPTGMTLVTGHLNWTPAIADTAQKHVAVQADDGHGGFDTLEWDVIVSPINVCAWGDSMPTARFSLSATVLNGVIYAAGGAKFFNSGGRLTPIPVSAVESYPLFSGPWTKKAGLVPARFALGLASCGNKLFSFGGTRDGVNHFASIDSLSPAGSVWDTAGFLPVPVAGSAVCAIGNKVYCIGGLAKVAGEDIVSDKIYEFDITSGQCILKNYMQTNRTFHSVAVVDGKIYIIGGLGGSTSQYDCVPLRSMEVYDPATNMIGQNAPDSLATARYYFGATEANGRLYAIGGCPSASSDAALSSIEEYDPVLNKWSVKASLPAARSNCAAVSWQGRVYVIGGIIAGNATSSVVIYYP